MLILTARFRTERQELSDVMLSLLHEEGEGWTELERRLLSESLAYPGADPVPPRTTALLAWLAHVSSNVRKSERYSSNWFWLCKHVEGVLFYLWQI